MPLSSSESASLSVDKDTEVQRGEGTSPRTHSCELRPTIQVSCLHPQFFSGLCYVFHLRATRLFPDTGQTALALLFWGSQMVDRLRTGLWPSESSACSPSFYLRAEQQHQTVRGWEGCDAILKDVIHECISMPRLQLTPICEEATPSPVYVCLGRALQAPHIPASPSFRSPLHLHPDTQYWINIPNTCSSLDSPRSKLHPRRTSGRKSQPHTLTSQSPVISTHRLLQPHVPPPPWKSGHS